MKKFFVSLFAALAIASGLTAVQVATAPEASAAPTYHCQYKYYPYTVKYVHSVGAMSYLTSTGAWRCFYWSKW